jgi:hypothetical protein
MSHPFQIKVNTFLYSVRHGRKDNRPGGKNEAPWAQDEDSSVYKQPGNAYGAGLAGPAGQLKGGSNIARQPSMKPAPKQEAPWAQEDPDFQRAPLRAGNKQDAPWAQDADPSVFEKPKNSYGAGVRGFDAGAVPTEPSKGARMVPRPSGGQNAPWAKADDLSVFRQPENAVGAGVQPHFNNDQPGKPQQARRPVKAEGPAAPWAQDDNVSSFNPPPNGYGAGVQAGGQEYEPRAVNRGGYKESQMADGGDAYMAPRNGYGVAQADGGLQAHRDAKKAADAIRAKLSGAGNVLCWS